MNPQTQNQNDILQALQALGGQYANNLPQVTIPGLNTQIPSSADMEAMYQQFLQRASNDPDIINYYSQILNQAQGDTQIAQNFLEQDYQNGTRNIQDNLTASLKQLGLTNTQEQNTLQDTLNKRGIALTQNDNGTTSYAGGGQAGTELGNLTQSQQLRQEAETRSASQQTQGLQTQLQKGLTSTGQQLTQTAQNIDQQKQAEIASRANQYFGLAQSGIGVNLQQGIQGQQQQILGMPPIQPGNNQPTLPAVAQNTPRSIGVTVGQSYDPTKITQAQRQYLFNAKGEKGIAPVGFGG
jgi:hypothetical protein